MNVKYYQTENGDCFSFEIIDSYQTVNGIMYYSKCRENGRFAWLDNNSGIQFEGNKRFEAVEIVNHDSIRLPYGYTIWGGEVRDRLPNGARFYLR